MEEKGPGKKKHKWQVQNRQEEVKNGIGNGEAEELICMTHGEELRGRNLEGACRAQGDKGRKKWDNYNSIINKTY